MGIIESAVHEVVLVSVEGLALKLGTSKARLLKLSSEFGFGRKVSIPANGNRVYLIGEEIKILQEYLDLASKNLGSLVTIDSASQKLGIAKCKLESIHSVHDIGRKFGKAVRFTKEDLKAVESVIDQQDRTVRGKHTLDEVSEITGIHYSLVAELCKKHDIGLHVGKRRMLTDEDIEKLKNVPSKHTRPEGTVTAKELAARLGCDYNWLRSVVKELELGIGNTHRILLDDIGVKAVEECFQKSFEENLQFRRAVRIRKARSKAINESQS